MCNTCDGSGIRGGSDTPVRCTPRSFVDGSRLCDHKNAATVIQECPHDCGGQYQQVVSSWYERLSSRLTLAKLTDSSVGGITSRTLKYLLINLAARFYFTRSCTCPSRLPSSSLSTLLYSTLLGPHHGVLRPPSALAGSATPPPSARGLAREARAQSSKRMCQLAASPAGRQAGWQAGARRSGGGRG